MDITQRFLSFSLLGAEWVMWLLIILSIASIGIMIERAVFFWRKAVRLETLLPDFRRLLGSGDFSGARKKIESEKGLEAQALLAAFNFIDQGTDAVEESINEGATLLRPRLEKRLAFLGTVGNNAPFVGLFGTVLGIIQAFHDLSLNTQGGAGTVMAGISEALVATAIGLLVALPAVAFFNLFQRLIHARLCRAEALGNDVLAQLKSHSC